MKIRVKRLPLTALRTFEAAARLGRFKDAAVELGVSPTTVSNQIRRLERDWSCRLFVRRPREVLLTDTGRSLGNVVRQAFASIARELENHAAASPKRVDLAVGPIFAARWLTPRLESFRQSLPSVELNVIGRPRITGPATMPAPIAVDWGDGAWPGLESAYLFSIRYAPGSVRVLRGHWAACRRPTTLSGSLSCTSTTGPSGVRGSNSSDGLGWSSGHPRSSPTPMSSCRPRSRGRASPLRPSRSRRRSCARAGC